MLFSQFYEEIQFWPTEGNVMLFMEKGKSLAARMEIQRNNILVQLQYRSLLLTVNK